RRNAVWRGSLCRQSNSGGQTMAHLDPDDRHRTTDYIDRGDASVGWAPLALVIAFLVLVAFLVFGTRWTPQADRASSNSRSETPKNAAERAASADPSPAKATVGRPRSKS